MKRKSKDFWKLSSRKATRKPVKIVKTNKRKKNNTFNLEINRRVVEIWVHLFNEENPGKDRELRGIWTCSISSLSHTPFRGSKESRQPSVVVKTISPAAIGGERRGLSSLKASFPDNCGQSFGLEDPFARLSLFDLTVVGKEAHACQELSESNDFNSSLPGAVDNPKANKGLTKNL